jgi:hemoglobin
MADMLPDVHRTVGGTEAWRRLSTAFYSRVDRDPRIRHLFPGKTLHCAIEELTAFLVQLFGGPSGDTQRRWWLSLRESHQRLTIRQEERAAWMENMAGALEDAAIEEPLRGALREFFERSSAHVVNSGGSVAAAPDRPDDAIRREIARRWARQCGLDEVVAAIRGGEAERAIALASGLQLDSSVRAGLLGMMMGSGNAALLAYVRERVGSDSALVRERYASRTLLHEASAQGNAAMVELLLRLGADAGERTAGSHTALYCLANEHRGSGGGDVVRLLVGSGAEVNASDGVKRCTPLHMAARRGHVEIAEALLDCGAEIDPRDSLGDTPLRRSVNCDKIPVAALLIARGANVRSIGNKGRTPSQAARSSGMKRLLGPA